MTRPARADLFGEPTLTSMILDAAGHNPDADVQRAWVRLIERYRDPVEKCLRAKLRGRGDLEADAHAFFAYLFELKVLPRYERQKGSFRQYVQGVIGRYAKSLRRPSRATGEELVEEGLASAPTESDLELEEESLWAQAVLRRALERLKEERERDARILLEAFGLTSGVPRSREDIAAELDMKTNAVNVALHRAKARLRELLLEEIRDLCPDVAVFDQENDALLGRLLESHPALMAAESVDTAE